MSANRLLSSDLHMGSPIYSSNGEKIGRLRFTVSDPEPPFEVRQLIIEKGMLLQRDATVPVEAVLASEKSGIRLNLTSAQALDLPEFTEGRFFQGSREGMREGHRDSARDFHREGGSSGAGKRGRRQGRRGHYSDRQGSGR
ncbi:MAG: hypothetical protein ACOX9B_05495 [Candidatus Xenobium sp.]|nr:hypothetical protein [Burkholderiales bacterium]